MKDFAELPTQSWTSCDDVATNLKSNEANVENIAVLDVMNATSNSNDAVSKLVKIWENKNAQRALRGAGLSTMAVSLAACGGGSSTTTTTTPTAPVTAAAQTFELTTRSNDFTGDTGNDTFDATTAGELNDGDDLDGAAGTDTLDATIGDDQVAPTLANIENIIVQSTSNNADLDLDNADTSVVSITVTSSATDLDILNMQNNVAISLVDVTSGADGLTLDFDNDALGTDEAALRINTDGSTVAIDTVVGGDDDITAITFNATGDASAITMDLTDITSVTFLGSADLELIGDNVFTEITSITGTAASGGLTIDLDNNAAAFTINLGSGDDSVVADTANTGTGGRTINLGAGNDILDLGSLGSEADDVFTGGAGTDTLVIADASDITAALTLGVSGFERLNGSEAATYDMSAFADDTDFTIVRATAAGTDIVFDEVRDSVTTLELSGNSDNVTVSRLVDGAANAITIAAIAATTIDEEVIVDEEETITITADFALTMTTGLSANDATSLTVSGDSNVDLSTVAATNLATVNVAGLTAAANFIADMSASTVNMTVTGNTAATGFTGIMNVDTGAGADTVTGTANNDVIDTNGGADTINAGAGNDVINSGAGIDTINAGAGNDTVTSNSGNDTITLGAGDDTFDIVGAFGTDTITDFTVADDLIDLTQYGADGNDGIIAAQSNADEEIVIVEETDANDTAAEIDALYEALADADGINQVYIAYNDANNTAKIYHIESDDGADDGGADFTVTLLGSLDLDATEWTALTNDNFVAIA